MNIQDEFNNFNENNDIDELRILLNVFYISIKNNNIENIKFFLNNPKFNPATNRNGGIRMAAENGFYNIVNFLWQDQRVKDTLKKDNINLYKELIEKDKIKEKVECF
tara:strand:- start:7592 stop:7912 length:321 start_codon:yes stop_codon:yes gene_type:complete